MAQPRRSRHRSRSHRGRGGRLARAGLRFLRCGGGAGARSWRRLHPHLHSRNGAAGARRPLRSRRRLVGARYRGAGMSEIDIGTVAKAYARWAPVYDLVFGAVFAAGRKASIAAAERVGGRILDVGIGTGISLTGYSPKNRVVGVDYCEPMLRKAHERVAEHGLTHVEALAVMDAQQLAFPDATFDAVVAQYVITTVPDPEAALDEIA